MRLVWLIGLGAVCAGASAQAETLPVAGIYAAGTDAPSRVRSIAIGDFSGRGGERLAFAIDTALRGAVIEGRPYFDLTFTAPAFGDSYTYDGGAASPARPARGGPDAVMRGIGEVQWRDIDAGTKQVEECAAKGDDGKCLEKKPVDYPCQSREVTLRPEVRLVSREGELLYAKGDTLTTSQRFCKDEKGSPSVDAMVEELARGFASGLRVDVAPEYRGEDIRLLESRDGIIKSDHAAFKAAVRQTKGDINGACRSFEALAANNPRDVSVLFNIGLCRESVGDLEGAGELYQMVLDVRPGKLEAQQGLGRIASRLRAEQQLALHLRRDPS
mgnify:CR=1 FL=1